VKVCAAINLGPFNRTHKRFDTIGEAVRYFTDEVAGVDYGTGVDDQVMDLYPQCEDCYSGATFHDYPMVRYTVGPRGGVVRHV
jgi:hypothetical protein